MSRLRTFREKRAHKNS